MTGGVVRHGHCEGGNSQTYTELIPEEYRRLGFSGDFITEAALSEPHPIRAAELEAKLPARVPFGSNSGWLALCFNRDVDPPTVVLVRRDENAIVDLVMGPRQ